MQAQDLKTAFANLNEKTSLVFQSKIKIPPSASPEFYVDRDYNPLNELKTHLLNSPSDDKILFTGHIGSGKSTELNRFVTFPEIEEKFFVIKYSISEVLNILDIDYIDFLLSLAAILYTSAMDAQLEFENSTLSIAANFIDYFKEGKEDLISFDSGRSLKTKVYNFFTGVTTILLREVTLRDKFRKSIQRNITQLVNLINDLILQIKTSLPGNKELLIVIDDLEKIPDVARADKLFNQAGSYMTTPACKIIYTVPIALYYSLNFKQMADTFSEDFFLPNINIHTQAQPVKIDPSGCMQEFLRKRLSEKLIDKDAADMAIENSAGVAREFIRILKRSCTKALTKERDIISYDVVAEVIAELRNEYSRGLLKRHFDVLKSIINNQPVEDEKTLMELFHSKVVLEYRNGERWTALNPIVKPLIK